MKELIYKLLTEDVNITSKVEAGKIYYDSFPENFNFDGKLGIAYNTSLSGYLREMTGEIYGKIHSIEIVIVAPDTKQLYQISDAIQEAVINKYYTTSESIPDPLWNEKFQWWEMSLVFTIER